MQKRYFLFGVNDAQSRLTRFLKEWSTIEGMQHDGKIVVNRTITMEEIADYIFVSRQTLHTLFKNLRNKNYLQWDRKQFVIDAGLWNNQKKENKQLINSAGL